MKPKQGTEPIESPVRRRGDKLLIPGLDLATTPEAVAERVAHLASPGVRRVQLAHDLFSLFNKSKQCCRPSLGRCHACYLHLILLMALRVLELLES